MLTNQSTKYYEFAHLLRGVAATIVFLFAHLLGVFWLNPNVACQLLGLSPCPISAEAPRVTYLINYFSWLNYGYIGVSLFFLISGFVIPFSLINLNAKQFLVARFFRIYPTYIVAFSCSLVVLIILTHGQLWFGYREIISQFSLTRDLAWIPSLDGVSWTLEIEVKFYLICAVFAETIRAGHYRKMIGILALLMSFQIIFSHISYSIEGNLFHGSLSAPWYGIVHALAMSFVFISYMLIGTLFNWHCRNLISTKQLIGLVSLTYLEFVFNWYESDFKYSFNPGYINYSLSLCCFSLVYIFRNRIKTPRFFKWMGDISYPLYAVHPILGYGLLYWLVIQRHLPNIMALPLTIAIILIFATILHRIVERPSNNLGKYLAKNLISNNYMKGIWRSRYFWTHLAMADLRSKWRRSIIGMFWSLIQPLGMTLLLSIVFSRLFHMDIVNYAPYILSGIITWEFIGASLTSGSLAFVQADAYIKQYKHPLAIYTLRLILSNLIVLALASLVLWIWALIVLPHNFGWPWLATLSFFPIMALIAWPLSTFLAYLGARFRDIPHAMGLCLQVIWFVSPVYFEAKMFRSGGLSGLVDYNPIYHLLQIIRAPILEGKWPTLLNYEFCLLSILIFSFLAILIGRKAEPRVIFYL